MTSARVGAATALLTLVFDQITKLWTLFAYDLPLREPVRLAPFLDLIVVWNRGISYGLFQQDSEAGRWALVALSLAAALGLLVWMCRAANPLLAISLALIAGGAVAPERLITHRFPLAETGAALAAARSREGVKVIVTNP